MPARLVTGFTTPTLKHFARNAGQSRFPGLCHGRVGRWVPALGPSGSTLFDVSGYTNHGVLTNMSRNTSWVMTEFGHAIDHAGAGSSDVVLFGQVPLLQILGDVSFGIRLITDSVQDSSDIITSTTGGELETQNTMFGLVWETSGGGNDIRYSHEFSAGSNQNNDFGVNLTSGVWRYIMCTRNIATKTVKLYVNGVQVGSDYVYTTDPSGGSITTFQIGASAGASDPMNGRWSEAIVYNRVLMLNEIQTLYDTPLADLMLGDDVYGLPGAAAAVRQRATIIG